jgi:hypothetical protein
MPLPPHSAGIDCIVVAQYDLDGVARGLEGFELGLESVG